LRYFYVLRLFGDLKYYVPITGKKNRTEVVQLEL